MSTASVLWIELSEPAHQLSTNFGSIASPQFTLGPSSIARLGAFEQIEQLIDRSTGKLRRFLQWLTLGSDAPDAPRMRSRRSSRSEYCA